MPPIDYALLERLVLHVARDAKGHGILVFLPGLGEILQLVEVLTRFTRSLPLSSLTEKLFVSIVALLPSP